MRDMGHGFGQASGHCWRMLNHADTTSYAKRWGQGKICAGGGSDPGFAACRVGSAALVAPTPGTGTYQPWTELGTQFSPGQY